MVSGIFSVKVGKNCTCIFSDLSFFSSRRIWVFFANPDPSKNYEVSDCSLFIKTCFNFSVRHARNWSIQYCFKTLQEANKFIENYKIETFSKFSVFQEDAGFGNKGLCNTRLLEFLQHVTFLKVEIQSFSRSMRVNWVEAQYA